MIWVWRATVEWYDRGKPKNSEKNLSQCHFSTTNPTWIYRARTRASAVRGQRLTTMARPNTEDYTETNGWSENLKRKYRLGRPRSRRNDSIKMVYYCMAQGMMDGTGCIHGPAGGRRSCDHGKCSAVPKFDLWLVKEFIYLFIYLCLFIYCALFKTLSVADIQHSITGW
jgi:hypothetical protein